jgi:hypothetical protein
MIQRHITGLLHAAEEAARLNDFIDAMAGEPVPSMAPPLAIAKEIEEQLLVVLAGQDPESIVGAIVLLRQLITRLEKLPGA